MAKFPSEVLAALAEREEVYVETGAGRRTIIWIVVDGQDVFVRSVRGERGQWYRDILADRRATIHFRGKPKREPVPVTAVQASDPQSIERCSRALVTKYTGIPGLKEMLEAEVLPTTVRLEPL